MVHFQLTQEPPDLELDDEEEVRSNRPVTGIEALADPTNFSDALVWCVMGAAAL